MAGRAKGIIIPISATDNSARAFESVQAQVAALRSQVSSLRSQLGGGGNPGEALAAGMKHATPEIAAASGLVREFEGNLPIRAVERFLTTTLGLGPALSTIFPLVGGIAFAGVVGEGISKLKEMRDTGKNAARDLADDFAQFQGKLRGTVDELELANSKLRDEIAILEKHPTNGLQTALFEARVEADKLNQSLIADIAQFEALIKQRAVGHLEGLVSGAATSTGAVSEVRDDARKYRQQLADEKKLYEQGLAAAGENQAQREAQEKNHFDRTSAINDEHAQHFRKRAGEVQKQQNDADNAAAQVRAAGLNAATPLDLTDIRDILSDAADSYDILKQKTQLTGVNVGLKNTKDGLEGKKRQGEAGNKAEEEARKAREAQDKFAAAERALAEATAREQSATDKASTTAQLAELDRAHKALLLSDETYYAARASVQANALAAERAGFDQEKAARQAEVDRLIGQNLTGNDAVTRNAKVLELKSKIVDLDGKIAKLTGDQAKNIAQQAESLDELSKRRIADADRLAAQLENERGGGTSARSKQSKDEFQEKRKTAVAEFGSEDAPAVRDLDQQQQIDQDQIKVKGAEQDLGQGDAGRRDRRAQIDDELRRGQISANQAQKDKIALDRDEAAAMQPLLEAYERLAADGDLAALDQVTSLKRRISELKEPVNEVAAEVRGQLDSAFERVFENIGKGKADLKDFGKLLQADLTKDVYKATIQPGIQAGLGLLIPNSKGQRFPQDPSLAQTPNHGGSGVRGTFGKLASSLFGGAGGADKATGQSFKVIIDNKSSTPVQATSATGSFDADLKEFVIHTVVENAFGGGAIKSLFGG